MPDLLEELQARTVEGAVQPARGLNYNYPLRRYMKPDKMVVLLQGDPQNRAYYRDKGYVELSETPPPGGRSERTIYEQDYLPDLVQKQQAKARLINTIYRLGAHNPGINVDYDWQDMSVEDCQAALEQIGRDTHSPIRTYTNRVPTGVTAAERTQEQRLLGGVETTLSEDGPSLEELQAKLEHQPAGTIQGTGYDPIDQAGRAQRQRRIPHAT